MNKFKVGDRVAVYTSIGREVGRILDLARDNTLGRPGDGYVRVSLKNTVLPRNHIETIYHVKQCRRLVKKERRRIWMAPEAVETLSETQFKARFSKIPVDPKWWTEFVEVKRK